MTTQLLPSTIPSSHVIIPESKPKHSEPVRKLGHTGKDTVVPFTVTLKSGLEKVVTFLINNGVTIIQVIQDVLAIKASAPAGTIYDLFKVVLHDCIGTVTQSRFITHTEDLTVPEEIAEHVRHIFGLDQSSKHKTYFRTQSLLPEVLSDASQPKVFYPNYLSTVYNFPSNTGKGQTIALIELGGGYTISTVQNYFKSLNLPVPNIVSVSVDGATNNPFDQSGANGEVQLDIEVVGALCPESTIVVYFAPNTDQGFYDAIIAAATDTTYNPSVISISWGAPEAYWTNSVMQEMNSAFQLCASKGISVFVAAGDNGASDGLDNGVDNVDYPGSSPFVTCCGGTTLRVYNGRRSTESVWNELNQNAGSTGGGVSTIFSVPSYQAKYAKKNANTGLPGRTVPDVAGDADPITGYIIDVDGTQQVIGGTSAVAPLYAALTARINAQNNRRCGFWNDKIYSHDKYFFDVKSGNNDGYRAGKGYDACTGLGVANGQLLSTIF